MTREHDTFERLAGALALGEATPEERNAFDAHAESCERCRNDAGDARAVIAALERSRDDETWRPSLDDAVEGRIRAARARHSAITVGALGWAVAASIVLNVAFASGFAGHLASAVRATSDSHNATIAARFAIESLAGSRR